MFSRPTYLVPDSVTNLNMSDVSSHEFLRMVEFARANRVSSSFFDMHHGHYALGDLTVIQQMGAQFVPACIPGIDDGLASKVYTLDIFPGHLDALFLKYRCLRFVASVYYSMYTRSFKTKSMSVMQEDFLLKNLSISLMDSVHEVHGDRGKCLSIEGYAYVPIDAVEDLYHPFLKVTIEDNALVISDMVGLELSTQLDYRAFDLVDGVAVCADVLRMPSQISTIELYSQNSVEIVRLRESIVGMGFENLNLAVTWSEIIGLLSSDISFSTLEDKVNDVLRDKRSIVPDIQQLVREAGCSEYVAYVGEKRSRYAEVKRKFHTVAHVTPYGRIHNSTHKRMIEVNGIGVLILDWSWCEVSDPCAAVISLREFISDKTQIIIYGPDDVFELFCHYVDRQNGPGYHMNDCYNHCSDGIQKRLRDLRFSPRYFSGGLVSWVFVPAPSFTIDIVGKVNVAIQCQDRIDVYLKGYTEDEMADFIMSLRAMGTQFNIQFMGACVGTLWFYFRFYAMFELRREFCFLDERFVHMQRFDLYRVVNGVNFKDEFYQTNKPNGFEVSLSDQFFTMHDNVWLYHPPSRNPSFQEHG